MKYRIHFRTYLLLRPVPHQSAGIYDIADATRLMASTRAADAMHGVNGDYWLVPV